MDITLIQLLNIINPEDRVRVYLVNRITGEIKGYRDFGVWTVHTSIATKSFVDHYGNNPVHEMCTIDDHTIGIFIIEVEAN